jgi:Flp pilus assembly protein TadG
VTATKRRLEDLRADRSAMALVEFALVFPVFVLFMTGGTELANYISVKMRISQMALQIADNAARIGAGSPLAAKQVSETDINDVFTGAQLSSTNLDLKKNGRVILSDLEPQAKPNTNNRYKIVWQRCFGDRVNASHYGKQGDQNLTGIGPAGRQATAQDDNATMFVELYFVYSPLLTRDWIPGVEMREIAAMSVRDRRDLTQIYNNEKAKISSC